MQRRKAITIEKSNRIKYALSNPQPIPDAPDVFDILPLGLVHSQKGDFIVDSESFKAMKQHMEGRKLDIVIDYEHQTLEGVQAPAAGWIKELVLTDHSIAAKTEWTDRARQYLKNREYRYCSPVVVAINHKAVELHSVALTNTPAIDGQFAIVNKDDMEEDMSMELIKALAALLKLPETAGEDEIISAVKALAETPAPAETVVNKTVAGLLGVAENADTAAVSAQIMALKNPANFVPASDFIALKAKLEERDANDVVEKALADGKITPAQKDWAVTYALKDKPGFEKFLSLSAAVPMGKTSLPAISAANPEGLSDEEVIVCKALGITEEDCKKAKERK